MKLFHLISMLFLSNLAFAQAPVVEGAHVRDRAMQKINAGMAEYEKSKPSFELRGYEIIVRKGTTESAFNLLTVAGQEAAKKVSNTANYVTGCTPTSVETMPLEIEAYTMKVATQRDSSLVAISWKIKELVHTEKVKMAACNIDKFDVKEFSGNLETALERGAELKIQQVENYQILIKRTN